MDKTTYARAEKMPLPSEGSILHLPIEQIYAEKGASKPLKRNESIRLAQSIRKYGISTPLVVTPTEVFPGFYRYCILEGGEIWQAACLAGVEKLPCVISAAPPQDPEIAEICAQIRAGKLHIFEQAAAIRHLSEHHALTRAQIAKETGFSPSAIANKLRLCRLSSAEQQEILRAGLSERHARAILRLTEPARRTSVLRTVAREKHSVAATEALVERYLAEDAALSTPQASPQVEGESNPQGSTPRARENTVKARKIPVSKPQTGSICPKRFVLHTLQPLYNSIERTLSIFRKTGRDAEMQAQESADEVLITIRIPNAT